MEGRQVRRMPLFSCLSLGCAKRELDSEIWMQGEVVVEGLYERSEKGTVAGSSKVGRESVWAMHARQWLVDEEMRAASRHDTDGYEFGYG